MKKSFSRIVLFVLVFISACFVFSEQVFADLTAPYLYLGGNYQYDADTQQLTFSNNFADFVEYTNGDFYDGTDPIVGAALTFGPLTNSISNPLVFSPSSITVEGYFSAVLDNFVVDGTSQLRYGRLSNIQRFDNGTSRYVDELLTNGGYGLIYMNFTPTAGDGSGIEHFTADSSGGIGGIVAAPIPPSALLFVSGFATLALRNSRKKRIS